MKAKQSMPKHRRRLFRTLRRHLSRVGNANLRRVMHKKTNSQIEDLAFRLRCFRHAARSNSDYDELIQQALKLHTYEDYYPYP